MEEPVTFVDPFELRREIQVHYSSLAERPDGDFHFHTGRRLAAILGYPEAETDPLPDAVIESFAGVHNPFSLGILKPGETVVDIGSGAGLDSILAGQQVGSGGRVIGIDMTPEMLEKARRNAEAVGLGHVEFREGLAEQLPVEPDRVDVVISNGVINLCPDKPAVFREIYRVLKPGGRIQIADIVNGVPLSEKSRRNIRLWCD